VKRRLTTRREGGRVDCSNLTLAGRGHDYFIDRLNDVDTIIDKVDPLNLIAMMLPLRVIELHTRLASFSF